MILRRKWGRKKICLSIGFALLLCPAFWDPVLALPVPDGENSVANIKVTGEMMEIGIPGERERAFFCWKDFSVDKGQEVKFLDAKSYLNLVTGGLRSYIDGKITAEGEIFLINPSGILFGKNARVDVGSLHLSTRNLEKSLFATWEEDGVLPLGGEVTGDIVNKGNLSATEILVEGKNITFLNDRNVNLKDVPASGDETTGEATSASEENSRYIDLSATGEIHIGYDALPENGKKYRAKNEGEITNYLLLRNRADLRNIETTGNYMLEQDIDFAAETGTKESFTPIGNFTGKFDGAGHRIKSLDIDRAGSENIGFFGTLGGTVENVGIETNVNGKKNVGGIAGTLSGRGIIKNSYHSGVVKGTGDNVGGVVGYANKNSVIANVYNKGIVEGEGNNYGGIVGNNNGKITTVHNEGDILSLGNAIGGVVGYNKNGNLSKAYNLGTVKTSLMDGEKIGGVIGSQFISGKYDRIYNAGEVLTGSGAKPQETSLIGDMPKVSNPENMSLTSFIENEWAPNDIDKIGGGGTWRIYEGRETTPFLKVFLNPAGKVTYAEVGSDESEGNSVGVYAKTGDFHGVNLETMDVKPNFLVVLPKNNGGSTGENQGGTTTSGDNTASGGSASENTNDGNTSDNTNSENINNDNANTGDTGGTDSADNTTSGNSGENTGGGGNTDENVNGHDSTEDSSQSDTQDSATGGSTSDSANTPGSNTQEETGGASQNSGSESSQNKEENSGGDDGGTGNEPSQEKTPKDKEPSAPPEEKPAGSGNTKEQTDTGSVKDKDDTKVAEYEPEETWPQEEEDNSVSSYEEADEEESIKTENIDKAQTDPVISAKSETHIEETLQDFPEEETDTYISKTKGNNETPISATSIKEPTIPNTTNAGTTTDSTITNDNTSKETLTPDDISTQEITAPETKNANTEAPPTENTGDAPTADELSALEDESLKKASSEDEGKDLPVLWEGTSLSTALDSAKKQAETEPVPKSEHLGASGKVPSPDMNSPIETSERSDADKDEKEQ